MKWITAILCKVCIHSWLAFVALGFFVDLMFIQWESLKKIHYFPSTVISKCRKWHLRGTYLKFFSRGSMPPNLPRGSHLQQSWARLCWAENSLLLVVRAGISETGILKIKFKILTLPPCELFNYKLIRPQGLGIYCYFLPRMVGELSLFARY